jgi:hypothetical protein
VRAVRVGAKQSAVVYELRREVPLMVFHQ